MLTQLTVRNFKRLDEVSIPLGDPVIFIGPNNSGKTTALQALALWDIGLKRWLEKYKDRKVTPRKRPGVTINRRDLISVPVPTALGELPRVPAPPNVPVPSVPVPAAPGVLRRNAHALCGRGTCGDRSLPDPRRTGHFRKSAG